MEHVFVCLSTFRDIYSLLVSSLDALHFYIKSTMCLNIYKKNVRSEAWLIAQTPTPPVLKKSNSGYVSGNRQSQMLVFFFYGGSRQARRATRQNIRRVAAKETIIYSLLWLAANSKHLPYLVAGYTRFLLYWCKLIMQCYDTKVHHDPCMLSLWLICMKISISLFFFSWNDYTVVMHFPDLRIY